MLQRGRKEGFEQGTGSSADEHHSGAPAAARDAGAGAGAAAVIGRSIQIDGDLRGEEDLRIEGEVSGTIHLKNNSLTIGTQGNIKADVYAKSIVVDGSMEGDLYGSERVAVRKNAQVAGNITAPRVSLEDGARFKGSIEMDQQAVDSALGTSRTGKQQPTSIDSAKAGEDPSQTPSTGQSPSTGQTSSTGGQSSTKRESAG